MSKTYIYILDFIMHVHHNMSNANGGAVGVLVVDSECCPRQCLKCLSKDALLTTHAYVWSMTHKQQKKWLLTELSAAHDRRTMSFAHHLEQSKLCLKAWLKATGISKSRYYETRLQYMSRYIPGSDDTLHKQTRFVISTEMAMQWLDIYANENGDKLPTSGRILLPSSTTMTSVYQVSYVHLGLGTK